ncbi:TPA: YSIRK-type signal peptide-containing protein [Streptococcus pyogenes]|nr:YSIRK-type signal peptide-containing protein [Streptococcus pyogenes]
MVRKDTNKQYSLRKLKKGTASVAVALSVIGAGLVVNTNEVSASVMTRRQSSDTKYLNQRVTELDLENHKLINENGRLINQNNELKAQNDQLETEKGDLEQRSEKLSSQKEALEKNNADLTYKNGELTKKLDEAEKNQLNKEQENQETIGALKKILDETVKDKIAKEQKSKQDFGALKQELAKKEEQNKISEASRQGLRRDLDASREAKKKVEKDLEEANSKLAALENLNKELEESKKLTEKEKAELQAKLEAEAKALKEQLAKQAEELAKLRAGKASDSQTPDAKPGNKAVPGKAQAPQAGTKPNQNKAPMKETKRQLPSTGETANPFFTAAALTVMATAGVAAVVKRKEEN